MFELCFFLSLRMLTSIRVYQTKILIPTKAFILFQTGSVMTYVYIQVYQEAHRLSKSDDPDLALIQLGSISNLHPQKHHPHHVQQQRESR